MIDIGSLYDAHRLAMVALMEANMVDAKTAVAIERVVALHWGKMEELAGAAVSPLHLHVLATDVVARILHERGGDQYHVDFVVWQLSDHAGYMRAALSREEE